MHNNLKYVKVELLNKLYEKVASGKVAELISSQLKSLNKWLVKRLKRKQKNMFADTDFILALIKESDWLKQNALRFMGKYKGQIRTSISVMVELALLCGRMKRPLLPTFANVFELAEVNETTYSICLTAGLYVDKHNINVFDAFHAAYCNKDKIISSDDIYEKVGIERVKLEN